MCFIHVNSKGNVNYLSKLWLNSPRYDKNITLSRMEHLIIIIIILWVHSYTLLHQTKMENHTFLLLLFYHTNKIQFVYIETHCNKFLNRNVKICSVSIEYFNGLVWVISFYGLYANVIYVYNQYSTKFWLFFLFYTSELVQPYQVLKYSQRCRNNWKITNRYRIIFTNFDIPSTWYVHWLI